MRSGRILVAPATAGLMLLAGCTLAGCTTVLPGIPIAAGPVPAAESPADPPAGSPAPSTPSGTPGARSALAADVVADECLLDALAFTALLGQPVLPPEQGEVERDGAIRQACYAEAAGDGTPLALINVYEPREGTPADFVRAAPAPGRRVLDGVGEAAVLVDTAPGWVLQLAGTRYVITIAVLDGEPSDDAWRTAATEALAALPA